LQRASQFATLTATSSASARSVGRTNTRSYSKMAYCSSCKGTVHRTTKICPHCGGDFTRLFGPVQAWGTYEPPPPPLSREEKQKLKEQAAEEKQKRKERAEVDWERGASQNINPDQWSMEEIRSFWMKLFKVVMYSCLLIVGFFVVAFIAA